MDIGKALTFVMDDERWKEKLGTGTVVLILTALLSLVLIGFVGVFLLLGYSVRLLQNVRNGVERPLPEWDQWGDDLTRGLKLFAAMFVWSLPMILFAVPLVIGGIMADSGGDAEIIGGLILTCGACFITLYSLVIGLASPGITIAFAEDENVMSGLQVTEIFHWTRRNIGQVIIAALVIWAGQLVIGTVASVAGLILCGIGTLVTIPLGSLVSNLFQFHIYGQLAQMYPLSGTNTVAPVSSPPASRVNDIGFSDAADDSFNSAAEDTQPGSPSDTDE